MTHKDYGQHDNMQSTKSSKNYYYYIKFENVNQKSEGKITIRTRKEPIAPHTLTGSIIHAYTRAFKAS